MCIMCLGVCAPQCTCKVKDCLYSKGFLASAMWILGLKSSEPSHQPKHFRFFKNRVLGAAEGGSEVKSTDCSSGGPEFNSQQPHVGSQPSVIRSGALFWPLWVPGTMW